MENEKQILSELANIKEILAEQNTLKKEVLNFTEGAKYLDLSPSCLYKKTSSGQIPHYKPENKKIYFNRVELNQWLQRNRVKSVEEIDQEASTYVTLKRGGAR